MPTLDQDLLGRSAALTDDELVAEFERATLPDDAFAHPDHVRLAWIYLRRMPLLDAIGRYRDGLRRFARAHGAPTNYHETITWAFLIIVHERLHETGPEPGWPEFAARHPDLLRFGDGALFEYYHRDVLSSDVARRIFVLPAREPAAAGA